MEDLEEQDDRLGDSDDMEKAVFELMRARLDAKRKLDPNAGLTPEDRAEVVDEAKAAVGRDTSVKTDPECFRDHRTPEQKAKDDKEHDELLAFIAKHSPR